MSASTKTKAGSKSAAKTSSKSPAKRRSSRANQSAPLGGGSDPQWYKDAIVYQLHVKTFCDGNEDGIGDFKGLRSKLPYLRSLGVTAVWLLPFYPSPLRDDGYDIADYFAVNPQYGTLRDFRDFLHAAHDLDLRVITELVMNHTSDQHAWFQKSRKAKRGSKWRDYYVWSDDPHKYADARIIFQDFEASNWTWDSEAEAYFWHRFFHHQPDLNFDNPEVCEAFKGVLDYWLGMGVDGLRLDAIPYLFEREGTNCENLPETHNYLKEIRAHVDGTFPGRMLLAEANQWPEDAVEYFGGGEGDECHMSFHFPVMPRMFMSLHMEDRYPIVDILDQTPAIPPTSQWATFLRNHDELTLEMVTDEERDFMYRAYAKDQRARINLGIRRRLAPLLQNNRRKIELITILLFSLPGTPIIYYGDEIGMGDNIYLGDRNGVRTPMQWSADKNAGFSRANPQSLLLPIVTDPAYHYEAVNVELQESNSSSLLWWTRRVIAQRKQLPALSRGTITFLAGENNKVLAFTREHENQRILVVINLSRFAQVASVGLSAYAGLTPVEVFSRNSFPTIEEDHYTFTLGPYDHFWLDISPTPDDTVGEDRIPTLHRRPDARYWERGAWKELEDVILPSYLARCKWFLGHRKGLLGVSVAEHIVVGADAGSKSNGNAARFLILETNYSEGEADRYALAVQTATGFDAYQLAEEWPEAVVCKWRDGEEEGILFDALVTPLFRDHLLSLITRNRRSTGWRGELAGRRARSAEAAFREKEPTSSSLLPLERKNAFVNYGNQFVLKLFRKLQPGMNPDIEMTRHLTRAGFGSVGQYAGRLEYRTREGELYTPGMLQLFASSESSCLEYAVGAAGRYIDRSDEAATGDTELNQATDAVFIENTALLAQRLGEMHMALASDLDDPDFAPEAFSKLYQRSIAQAINGVLRSVQRQIQRALPGLPEPTRVAANELLTLGSKLPAIWAPLTAKKLDARRVRIHGDFHLEQVLYTGRDFVLIDFEGNVSRSLSERRLKACTFRDVAGMLMSFRHAAHLATCQAAAYRPDDQPALEKFADEWYAHVYEAFLDRYFETVAPGDFLPADPQDRTDLLRCFLLRKALYLAADALDHRPHEAIVPLRAINELAEQKS